MSDDVKDVARGLAELWQQALGAEKVSLDDDFFDLGGNSITAIRLVPLIEERFDVEPNITLIFDHPTPLELADALVGLRDS